MRKLIVALSAAILMASANIAGADAPKVQAAAPSVQTPSMMCATEIPCATVFGLICGPFPWLGVCHLM